MNPRELPSWLRPYIGLPFKDRGRDRNGIDCWGHVRLILREQFGVDLPAYDTGYASTGKEDAALIAAAIREHRLAWDVVTECDEIGRIVLGDERPGDVILIRQWGEACHLGLTVCKGWMTHIEEGIDSVAAEYDGSIWRQRLVGFYRHPSLRLQPSVVA